MEEKISLEFLNSARVKTLVGGVCLTWVCLYLRLDAWNHFTGITWSPGSVEMSNGYQRMMAWIDLYNLGMYTGVALVLIAVFGWREKALGGWTHCGDAAEGRGRED